MQIKLARNYQELAEEQETIAALRHQVQTLQNQLNFLHLPLFRNRDNEKKECSLISCDYRAMDNGQWPKP